MPNEQVDLDCNICVVYRMLQSVYSFFWRKNSQNSAFFQGSLATFSKEDISYIS